MLILSMIEKGYERTFTVKVARARRSSRHDTLGTCIYEIWENEAGEQFRPNDLPSCTAYHPKNGRVIYQEWTLENDTTGVRQGRANGKPAEIRSDEHHPRMCWFKDGYITHIAYPTAAVSDPSTGEIVEFEYDDPPNPIMDKYNSLPIPSV